MDYIGNVVITDNSKVNLDKTFKRCNTLVDTIPQLPTLIIGYKNAQKWVKDYDILKKWYPEQNLYWTFGKTERKYEYDEDIDKFYNISIEKVYKNIKYFYFDLINCSLSETKRFIKYLSNHSRKVVYNERNKFLYIYNENKHTVIGLSLDLCEYIGIKKVNVLNKLKNNKNIIMFNGISFLNRKLRELSFTNKHYIPVFYNYFKT